MDRNLQKESIDICKSILENHNYSFHMFRRIFQRRISNDDLMNDYWYNDGDFKNMRLYKYITALGYRKVDTILEKIKPPVDITDD